LFKHFRLQSQIATFHLKLASTPSIDEILQFAENQYSLMSLTGKWTGVHSKANEMVFLAALQAATNSGAKFTICFNCGGLHHVSNCPKPTDTSCIKANQKLFKANRPCKGAGSGGGSSMTPCALTNNSSGGGTSSGTHTSKWAPPTDAEKKNRNCHLIDGKVHFYHHKTRRWVPVNEKASLQVTSGPATTLTNTASVQQPACSVTPVASNQTRDVAVTNAARQLEMTFQGLLNQFHLVT
jgi:hypothetical protein